MKKLLGQAVLRGMETARTDIKHKLDLLRRVKFFLEKHPNSTNQEIALGIGRTPHEVESACDVLEEIGQIKSRFRLKADRRRKGGVN